MDHSGNGCRFTCLEHNQDAEEVMLATVPPHSVEAEQALLGACLLNRHACDIAVASVSPSDFYWEKNSIIFAAIQKIRMSGGEVDVLSVSNSMHSDELAKVEKGYIYSLTEFVGTACNVSEYIKIVKDTSLRRSVIRYCGEIAQKAYDDPDADELMVLVESKLNQLSTSDFDDIEPMADLLVRAEERINKAARGESLCGRRTYLDGLNQFIGGLEPGTVFVLAARPSLGKSALAMNIASHVAVDDPVLFLSAEMSANELIDRLIANESQVPLATLRGGLLTEQQKEKMIAACERLSSLKLFIDDKVQTLYDVLSASRRKMAKLIVIDYLQLLSSGKKSEARHLEIASMTRRLKLMARELDATILLLSQLSRPDSKYQSEGGEQQVPMLSALRDSGAIEQDADIVAFIHWPKLDKPDHVKLIVAKNRNGSVGTVHLRYVPQTLTFLERV